MSPFRKGLSVVLAAALSFVISSNAFADAKISLRLQGGWASLSAGDINPATGDLFAWAPANAYIWVGVLDWGGMKALRGGYEFGGDIILEFSPYFGVGIGAGYIQASQASSGTIGYEESLVVTAGVRADSRISAVPVRIGLFVTLPLRGKFRVIANAGVGYYSAAKYKGEWGVGTTLMDSAGPSNLVDTVAEKRSNAFGFHGGLGIEYSLASRVGFFIEARGRYARFRGLEGTSTAIAGHSGLYGQIFPPFSETGKLYYESVPTIIGSPRLLMVQGAPPDGPGGHPREAVVDFSGISIQAGVQFRF